MSTEDELKEAMGDLVSGRGPRPVGMGTPVGSTDPDSKIHALEADIRRLYDGLLLLARQIDDIRR